MIECSKCNSEDSTVLVDHEGGEGKTYYEFWQCLECQEYWTEKYILYKQKIEEE
jgi:transcriptional regulator NrdR family protein